MIDIIMTAVAAVVAVYVGPPIKAWLKMNIENKHREVLQETIVYALNWAVEKTKASNFGHLPVGEKKKIVTLAAAYVKDAVPDALKQFGMDTGVKEGRAQLSTMVEARLNHRMFDAEVEEKDNVTDLRPVTH